MWLQPSRTLADACSAARALRLLLLPAAFLDQHLAHGCADLALEAVAAQLALVRQVVEVGEALGVRLLLTQMQFFP